VAKRKQQSLAKPLKPLSPEMAERMLRSLNNLYEDHVELEPQDRDRIRKAIIERVKQYAKED